MKVQKEFLQLSAPIVTKADLPCPSSQEDLPVVFLIWSPLVALLDDTRLYRINQQLFLLLSIPDFRAVDKGFLGGCE